MSAIKQRVACDRCHGQKMRCIREGTQTKCNRCLAARAECVYSTARKAGRPSAATSVPSGSTSRSTNISTRTTPIEGSRHEGETEREKEKEREKKRGPAYRDYSGDLSPGVDFSSDMSLFEGSGLLLDDDAPSFIFSADASASVAMGSQELWDESQSHQYPDLDSGMVSEDYQTPSPLFVMAGTTGDTHYNTPPRRVADESKVERAKPGSGPSAVNTMQQLSELGGKLFANTSSPCPYPRNSCQHRRISRDTNPMDFDPDPNPAAQFARLEQLTAHVIESSVSFYNILRNTSGHIAFDTAATLLILTTYIRLAQLHHSLYMQIQSILAPTPSPSAVDSFPGSPKPPPCPDKVVQSVPIIFPSLHIGGVSLSPYPRFQLKFILQICVHHLGEVEALLGLPDGFCVSEKGQDRGDGGCTSILHQVTESSMLVRTIMLEADETVKGIRRALAELVEELRGSIQV